MKITVEQAWEGVDLQLENGDGGNDSSTASVRYIVSGTTDESEACMECFKQAPETYSGIAKRAVAVSERLTDSTWKIEVRYGAEYGMLDDGDEDEEPSVNFDCSAGTKHVVQAIRQTCVYAGSGESTDSSSVASAIPIGWNGKDGSESDATGVDVVAGELRETYTKTLNRSKVTSTSWKRKVAELVGKVNSGSFKGWRAGEVQFLGCSYTASLKGYSKVNVSFHFCIRLNENNALIAGRRIGNKKGFEYLWAMTDDEIRSGTRYRRIRKIYKAEVCDSTSFSALGL